ncbi:MAG: DUF5688 family protein [Lachnospiraceae bacterium]|nr:DUF5688 family protein [Lachnospiraceae bacterium]
MNSSYEEFRNSVLRMVQEYYGNEAWVMVDKLKKLNRPDQEGLSILIKGKNVCPVIYLNNYYDEWNCGKSIEAIAADIIEVYKKHCNDMQEFDMEAFRDYQKVEGHLFCRLVNYENNRGLLKELPHIRFHDLALVYFYASDDITDFEMKITVKNDFLEMWHITKEQLHQRALQNTRNRMDFQLTSIKSVIEDLISMKPEVPHGSEDSDSMGISEVISRIDEDNGPSIYVLSNQQLMYGAVGVFFDEVLRMASNRLQEDFYVLPSSIHECLIVPVEGFKDLGAEYLKEVVQFVNENYVNPAEILGDCVYRYDCSEEKLSIVA